MRIANGEHNSFALIINRAIEQEGGRIPKRFLAAVSPIDVCPVDDGLAWPCLLPLLCLTNNTHYLSFTRCTFSIHIHIPWHRQEKKL